MRSAPQQPAGAFLGTRVLRLNLFCFCILNEIKEEEESPRLDWCTAVAKGCCQRAFIYSLRLTSRWNPMVKSLHRQRSPTSLKAEFTTERTTESWQAPRVFIRLPKTSKLLFTFILASSCKFAFAASHSKYYPFIPFLRSRVGVRKRSRRGCKRYFSSQVSLFFFSPPPHTAFARRLHQLPPESPLVQRK